MGRSTSFGTFLFKPQWFTKCSLGSIGYFDKTGDWNQVTNLLEKGRAEKDGYKPFPSESDPLELELSEVTESRWETGSAEKETGRSSRLRTEASGAMAAAPVEASVQVKTKNTSTGSAALVTPSVVRNHKFQGPFKDQIMDWIEDNAPKLHSRRQVRERGLWAIMSAWVTDECAVKMTSGKTRDIDLSFDLGATGIGKAGSGIGVFDKLKREDWQVYSPDEVSAYCFLA